MNTQRIPRVTDTAVVQLRFLWRTRYIGIITMILGAALAHLYRIPDAQRLPWMPPLLSTLTVPMVIIGCVAALVVWFNEGPNNRRYHWAMPVDREVHDVLRIAAGAVWLLIAISLFCVLAWYGEPEASRNLWLARAPWFWFGMFAVPLLAYVLATIPALLTGRPLVWLLSALLLGITIASPFAEKYAPALHKVGSALFSYYQPPSLSVAFTGGDRTAPWSDTDELIRVFRANVDSVSVERGTPQRMGITEASARAYYHFETPYQVSDWLLSLALWYGIGIFGLALAVTRRPDV